MALILRKKILGEKNIETANSYRNVAATLQGLGRLTEAYRYYLKAMKICLILRDERGITRCYSSIASVLQSVGRLEEAYAQYLKALKWL